jgi:hypothetical protein
MELLKVGTFLAIAVAVAIVEWHQDCFVVFGRQWRDLNL